MVRAKNKTVAPGHRILQQLDRRIGKLHDHPTDGTDQVVVVLAAPDMFVSRALSGRLESRLANDSRALEQRKGTINRRFRDRQPLFLELTRQVVGVEMPLRIAN